MKRCRLPRERDGKRNGHTVETTAVVKFRRELLPFLLQRKTRKRNAPLESCAGHRLLRFEVWSALERGASWHGQVRRQYAEMELIPYGIRTNH